ncbi:hypothetical protein VIGAN_08319700 [Vigna angularis var. angularis]|uniref:Uncharacterized protein n=2 Tax=Phaseolus angularis TaxID=3914 RepID=A0A0S3STY5_PHAAN|nr:transcriptional corepressor LEUNIG_HOMOLOG isoform X1 [Vigna angularis]BAT96282.1 hypothetical protein VIGAN_08319700 [Vigna angularis var. angularis]
MDNNSLPDDLPNFDDIGFLEDDEESLSSQDDVEHFGDDGFLEDNVELFPPQDDGDGRNPSEHDTDAMKGFTFAEVGFMRKCNSKVVCCHFSSDGKLLASAGHDKKVVLWNMETLQTETTPEDHSLIITDVRFRPNSTQLATSSFDKIVRLWDAANPTFSLQAYSGHSSHVLSLDFHPRKNDFFCSCDDINEIRFWNISQYSSIRRFKGGSTQVRFQPRVGHLLAAGSGSSVSLFDVETCRPMHTFQGHSADVSFVCWDPNGDYFASMSQERVKVWSIATGECIHELNFNGNIYHSCVFHPSYSTLLVIGGYEGKCQSDEFWENHIKQKWGRVIGDAVYKEWKRHVAIAKDGVLLKNQHTNQTASMGSFSGVWPNLFLASYLEDFKVLNVQKSNNFMMSLYFSLENGSFWFPAQVYKGLMIHNVLVSYDSQSNTFQARYQNGGWRCLGKNIEWDMVRAPSVDTPPYVVHLSHCLDTLKPEDHIEIQWRPNTQSPYDWWYAVIGHLDSCNKNCCQCEYNDTLIVEFRQYPEISNMRRIKLCRKTNEEEGHRIGGYYGGIRKLQNHNEIETWKKLFPLQIQTPPVLYMFPVAAHFQIL